MGACIENGVCLAALSSLFFSLCSLVAKFLVDLHPLQLTWFSLLGIVIVSGVPAVRHKEWLLPREYITLLFGRSLVGTLFLLSSFYSVKLIPLGDASVLFYTAPAFTVLLAKWLLKEPCSLKNIVMAFVMMGCVILVMKPPFIFEATGVTSDYLLGVVTAVIASLCDALGNIALRDLRGLHFSVILFNYGIISLLITTVVSLIFWNWAFINLNDAILILILVILNSGEQLFMTLALHYEHAGIVAIAQASDIIYGYAFQIFFFKESADIWSIFGALMIGILIVLMSIDSKKRKRGIHILTY